MPTQSPAFSIPAILDAGEVRLSGVIGSIALSLWIGVVLAGLAVYSAVELWAMKAKGAPSPVVASTPCMLPVGLVVRAVVVIGGQM